MPNIWPPSNGYTGIRLKTAKAVRIEATAIGGAIDSTTRQGFRGAFISPVKDVSVGDEDRIEFSRFATHDFVVDERTNASVNSNQWQEGLEPFIEFRSSKDEENLSGSIKLDLLCVFQGKFLDFENVEIEVKMQKIDGWKHDLLDTITLNFND